MLRRKNLLFLLLTLLIFTSCKKETTKADYQIIPLPQSLTLKDGAPFVLNGSTVIVYAADNSKMKKTAEFLSDYIKIATGETLKLSTKEQADNAIVLKSDYTNENSEAYVLTVNSKQIVINGASDAGAFYGVQTLRKSIPADASGKDVSMGAVEITDYPRFAYRGMMLDVGRHFFPIEFIKKYIDILALHNINRFHWHLTEDQGWRIEIKKHPKLTEIGSMRKHTLIGKMEGQYDGTPYGGFYTQDEAKEIVAYAADRFITVIPEIDLPGHMLAALTAYPELGCTGGPYEVAPSWGVFDDVLCMGNEKTFALLEDVFAELVEIFPSKYIHVGGDECPKVRWKECPKCQAKIKDLKLKADKHHSAEDKLQSYCISRLEKFLNGKGRDIIGWDEILEGGLAPNATVMSWRGMEGGVAAAKLGHDVIMVPTSHGYFDYYQTDRIDKEPVGIGGYVPLDKVYSFEPVSPELTAEEAKHVIGTQANMWTEYLRESSRVEYQLLPRLAALAEVQWTMPEKKNYENFTSRLGNSLVKLYDKLDYNYAKFFSDIQAHVASNPATRTVNVNLSTFDQAPIYYTLDGSIPTAESPKYTAPLEIKEAAILKALAIRPEGKSELYSTEISLSKSSFKPITSKSKSHKSYTFEGLSLLVDGLKGGNSYKDQKWVGFSEDDKIEFTIDLLEDTEVSSIKIGTYVATGDWIFGAVGLAISVSDDGNKYKEVSRNSFFEASRSLPAGRVGLDISFAPEITRYMKITVAKTSRIPDWHIGKGASPFIFMDEIAVN